MLRAEIIRLAKEGVDTVEIMKRLSTTRGYIGDVLSQSDIELPRCKICGRKILSLNSAHIRMHNMSFDDYFRIYPEERRHIRIKRIWCTGLTKHTNDSLARAALKTKKRMNTVREKKKSGAKFKKLWNKGFFKIDRNLCLKANQAWVNKVKSASLDDRKKMLHNFTSAGNAAQSVIRMRNKLNVDFIKMKYPWAQNVQKKNCFICGKEFISAKNKRHLCCSVECLKKFNNMPYRGYYYNESTRSRIIMTKCRNCQVQFPSVQSKWSKRFCSIGCWKNWLYTHPHFTVKHRYFSEKFQMEYIYDSSYELSFINWCEYEDDVVSLERNRPIIVYNSFRRYFPDFLVNNLKVVEIKANYLKIYNVSKEISKIKAGMLFGNFKLITEKSLYEHKKIINACKLYDIVFGEGNFIDGAWNEITR